MKFPINIHELAKKWQFRKGSPETDSLVSICILLNIAYEQGREAGRKEART